MNRDHEKRGTMMILALLLIMLAGGLLAVIGATVTEAVRTDRLESNRAILRQAIDSGVAWARLHRNNWPRGAGAPAVVRLDIGASGKCRIDVKLTPVDVSRNEVRQVRVEASLHRPRGRRAMQTVTASIARELANRQ